MLYKGYRNLTPNESIKDLWLAANKGNTPLEISINRFPGCWTVKNYSIDVTMFCMAIFFEIVFLLFIFTQAGVQLFLVIAALLSVIIDLISALAHNVKRKEITKERIVLSVLKYLRELSDSKNITDPSNTFGFTDPDLRAQKKLIRKSKNNLWRIAGTVLIIVSWLVKVFVTTVTFGLPIIIFASVVIFAFVAYIHLFHTGYTFLGFLFYFKLNKIAKKDGNLLLTGKDTDSDFTKISLGIIPDAINFHEINRNIDHIGENVNVCDSLVKESDNTWVIRKWNHHFWDDEDMSNFIQSNNGGIGTTLVPEAQAYLMYKIYTNIFKPSI